MIDPEKLDQLVGEWEQARSSGVNVSAEDICRDDPEYLSELRRWTKALEGTDWLNDQRVAEDDPALSPRFFSSPPRCIEQTIDAAGDLTVDEFASSLAANGLLTSSEIDTVRRELSDEQPGHDAGQLLRALLSRGKLTEYQAQVLMKQRNDPLLIDKYLVLDAIDSGGMGIVFKALHRAMDRIVALKVLPLGATDAPHKIDRFRREIRVVAQLSHPHIVTAHDADESNGIHFLVMEYVAGDNLQTTVLKHGPLDMDRAVDCVLQAAAGLEYAHGQGVIHRDIKPSNLLVTAEGTIKVADLGIAAVRDASLDGSIRATRDGTVMGTVAYMSPEQALDACQADERSDIYSLGATLYFLLSGRPMHNEETELHTLLAHREQPAPSLCAVNPDVPEGLDRVYQRMVARDPEDRYPSMVAVQEALIAVRGAETADALIRDTASRSSGRSGDGNARPWPMWAAGAAVISALVLLGTVVFRVKTADGTIVIETVGADLDGADVAIDGRNRLTIRTSDGGPPLALSVDPGRHTLRVSRNGFLTFTREFEVRSGDREVLRVWLDRDDVEMPLEADESLTFAPLPVGELSHTDPEILPGLVARPAKIGDERRWQLETRLPRSVVRRIAIHPAEPLVALGCVTGLIRIYDTTSFELVSLYCGHTLPITTLAWSPDGRRLASGSCDGTVRLWSRNGVSDVIAGGRQHVAAAAWAPDGTRLAVASVSGIEIFAPDGRTLTEITDHIHRVRSVDWSDDGLYLVSLDNIERVRIWKQNGDHVRDIGLDRVGQQAAWRPGSQQFAVALNNHSIEIRDITGTLVDSYPAHKFTVEEIAWSPDGKHLASVSRDRHVCLRDIEGGRSTSFRAHGHSIATVAWSLDGSQLVTSSVGRRVRFWDLHGNLARELAAVPDSTGLAWSPSGRVAVGLRNGTIRIWSADGRSNDPLHTGLGTVRSVDWSSDNTLACAAYSVVLLYPPGGRAPERLSNHVDRAASIAWSLDGTSLAIGGVDGTVLCRDTANPDQLTTVSRGGSGAYGVAWHPDSRQLAVWSFADDHVRLHHKASGSSSDFPVPTRACEFAWSPDGRFLASAGQAIRIVDSQDKANVVELPFSPIFHGTGSKSLAWHPDSQRIAYMSRVDRVTISDVRSLDAQTVGPAFAAKVRWDREGRRLAVSGTDSTLRVFDGESTEPQWVGVMLSDGAVLTLDPAGNVLTDAESLTDDNFVYVVENESGGLTLNGVSEFRTQVGAQP